MEPTQISTQQLVIYAVLLNAAVGFLLGLVPLIFGLVKGQRRYGILGLVVSTAGGALLGVIIAVPAMLIFTWLIVNRSRADGTGGTTA